MTEIPQEIAQRLMIAAGYCPVPVTATEGTLCGEALPCETHTARCTVAIGHDGEEVDRCGEPLPCETHAPAGTSPLRPTWVTMAAILAAERRRAECGIVDADTLPAAGTPPTRPTWFSTEYFRDAERRRAEFGRLLNGDWPAPEQPADVADYVHGEVASRRDDDQGWISGSCG